MRSLLTIVIALVVMGFLWDAKVKLEFWHGKVAETLARVNANNAAMNASVEAPGISAGPEPNPAQRSEDYRTLIGLLEHKPFGLPRNSSENEVLGQIKKELQETSRQAPNESPLRLAEPTPPPANVIPSQPPVNATASIPRPAAPPQPTPARIRYLLKTARKVTTPYGSATVAAGTEVVPVSSGPGSVKVRAAGQEFVVAPGDLTQVAY